MGRLLGFLWGFILSFFKLLFGSILLCVIVGFFFMPALYVLVPLSAIAIVVESFKEESSGLKAISLMTNSKDKMFKNI
ncbi:hypothetical protein AAHB49_16365 [Bacillus cereus]